MSGCLELRESDQRKADRRVSQSVEELLSGISDRLQRRYSVDSDTSTGGRGSAGYSSLDQSRGCRSVSFTRGSFLSRQVLQKKSTSDLEALRRTLIVEVKAVSSLLVHQLKVRDKHTRKRLLKYDLITAYLQAMSPKRSVDTQMRFSIYPFPGDHCFFHWCSAIKMAVRLRGGIPLEFRKAIWLSLANQHIETRKIDWEKTKWSCLNERSNPDDDKLGAQIVKDLHRTGCSLFTGKETEHNQALLKMVLLAYARWNTQVGYCQGFNMLGAILLEVMEWKEDDALKVMIYLIEGVLPKGYFALHMRDLSVDMAVFRDLLKTKLPVLAQHLTKLQLQAQDTITGTSYEPPLINVFTMQWFLTLFSNCLPKSAVLRVWDIILLEGNDVLLKTALTIWAGLEKRVMTVASADEFYSIMGALTREMLEFGIMETNDLIQAICKENPSTVDDLNGMRDKYAYNIRPLSGSSTLLPFEARTASPANKKRSIKLCFSDDEEDMDDIAMATWCTLAGDAHLSQAAKDASSAISKVKPNKTRRKSKTAEVDNFHNHLTTDRMSEDISSLKKQYAKLKERQKQAHIIMTGAFAEQSASRPPVQTAVSQLLAGRKALVVKSRFVPKLKFDLKTVKKESLRVKTSKGLHERTCESPSPTSIETSSVHVQSKSHQSTLSVVDSSVSSTDTDSGDENYQSLEESPKEYCTDPTDFPNKP